MSYRIHPPRRVTREALLPRRSQPQPPPIYPIQVVGDVPPDIPLAPLPQPDDRKKKVLGALAVLAILIIFLIWLDGQQKKKVAQNRERSRPSKRSTAQMAKDLYRRLEKNGGVSETTMRSLAQISRDA